MSTGFRRTAAISIAALFKQNMKKGITILFILTTTIFCVLLYFFLFYSDHHAKRLLLAGISAGLVATCIIMIWLYNKYMTLTLPKDEPGKK